MNKGKSKKQKIFLWTGILTLLVGLLLIGLSIFYIVSYDKVEGDLIVLKMGPNNRKQAYITYEYDGELYEDVGLSGFNAFTMKDGKEYTVYINPDKPDRTKTTNFTFGIILVLFGLWVIKVGASESNNTKEDVPWRK